MKKLELVKQILHEQKKSLTQEYGISEMGIFGSFIRGEAKENSDLDILVRLGKRMGLLKFIGLENYLSGLLGIKVDLVMKDALKPAIGRQILNEVMYLW